MLANRCLPLTFVFCGFVLLSGCASNKVSVSHEEFSAVMAQTGANVDSLIERGNKEEAVKLLGDLAKKNPGRKEPWVRTARVYFDAGNYAQAIVAAEEALQRDGTDRTAKSIRAVAGLRVAAQSLTDLRGDVELKGDARSDAVGLAKVMRETLGEEVLVPPDDPKKKKPAPVVSRPKLSSPVPLPAAKPASASPAPAAAGANPFSVLK